MNIEQTKEDLIKKFVSKVSENETDLINAFKEFLNIAEESLKNSDNEFVDKSDNAIIEVLNALTADLLSQGIDNIKKELLNDDAFITLTKESKQIRDIIQSNLLEEYRNAVNIEETKEKLINLSNEVKSYNSEEAMLLLSETLLDLDYIKDPNTKITSIHMMSSKK